MFIVSSRRWAGLPTSLLHSYDAAGILRLLAIASMTDITPKGRLEGKRGLVIHTRPWPEIIEHYRKHGGQAFLPMLRLVESIAASPASSEVFGATSMLGLLLSDTPNFRGGDSTLQVSYDSAAHQFLFRHKTFSGHDDQKICAESEVLETLRLFLRMKYGVLFEPAG